MSMRLAVFGKGAGFGLQRVALVIATVLAAASVVGCTTFSGQKLLAGSGVRCVDDSAHCVNARQRTLRWMRRDTSRGWVRGRPDARTYAAGVRLFAFRLEKSKLTCAELATGVREAQLAPQFLNGASAKGLTPAQVSRGLMLSDEVRRELLKEQRRRCR